MQKEIHVHFEIQGWLASWRRQPYWSRFCSPSQAHLGERARCEPHRRLHGHGPQSPERVARSLCNRLPLKNTVIGLFQNTAEGELHVTAGAAPISNTILVSLAALPHPGVYLTLTLLQSSPEEPLRIGSVPIPLTSLIQGCQFSWQLLLRPLLLWVLKLFANPLSPNSCLSIPDAPECSCSNGSPSHRLHPRVRLPSIRSGLLAAYVFHVQIPLSACLAQTSLSVISAGCYLSLSLWGNK